MNKEVCMHKSECHLEADGCVNDMLHLPDTYGSCEDQNERYKCSDAGQEDGLHFGVPCHHKHNLI
jgi:hypothetical protein